MSLRISPGAGCALLLATISLFVSGQQPSASSNPRTAIGDRQRRLHSLLDEEWDYELRTDPERATAYGDNRYNDRLGSYSAESIRSDLENRRKFLARLNAIDAAGLSPEDALSRALLIRNLREQIEEARFKPWEMPVNQRSGPHLSLPDLVTLTPFATTADYDNYLARLHQVPRIFDEVTGNLRQGMRDGLMPPRYLLEKVAAQAAEVGSQSAGASPFARPLESFPVGVPAVEQKRLREVLLAVIRDKVLPAYRRFARFVSREYAPHGRAEPGIWSLPEGAARYRFEIRRLTTTDFTPDQLHEMGLKLVAEAEAEMVALAHQLGFADLAGLNNHIRNERRFYAASGEQLLELYATYSRQMETELPKMFGRLPGNRLSVIPMDPFRAPDAVPADYTAGAADGSRPGRINVNEWDPQHRLLLNVEAIAYHEGIPGHHLQISIGQELPGLPAFRRHTEYTAFVEGWALYAERLAKELGFYQDPYSNYGRLENEMWRAIRLVVDTGVHEKHWSRDRMVEFFRRYTAMDEPNIQTEVDRYIAWPGQALAYKLGQLEILKLRDQARQKLGKRFDIRAFHDEVLGHGALPLDVLDSLLNTWIDTQAR